MTNVKKSPQPSKHKDLPPHLSVGAFGEDYACFHLQKLGFRILERNFRARYGEIDIVALPPVDQEEVLLCIEVKTRTSIQFGTPEEAITKRKLYELIKTSAYYLLLHPEHVAHRIDVISILCSPAYEVLSLQHFENITL